MVRPVALSRSKVDVVIGNPPWINYNQTADILRDELKSLSRNRYGIWAGRQFATQQDVAGLFYARGVDLYLKDGGVIGFVLPHSALQGGQYAKWRERSVAGAQNGTERTGGLHLSNRHGIWSNSSQIAFFPIPASVAFARKLAQDTSGKALAGKIERWRGRPGGRRHAA